MISFIHTPDGLDFMFGCEEMPRQGELLNVKPDYGDGPDERDGLYEVEKVLHQIPTGRVDIYARRVGDPPRKADWKSVMGPADPTPEEVAAVDALKAMADEAQSVVREDGEFWGRERIKDWFDFNTLETVITTAEKYGWSRRAEED